MRKTVQLCVQSWRLSKKTWVTGALIDFLHERTSLDQVQDPSSCGWYLSWEDLQQSHLITEIVSMKEQVILITYLCLICIFHLLNWKNFSGVFFLFFCLTVASVSSEWGGHKDNSSQFIPGDRAPRSIWIIYYCEDIGDGWTVWCVRQDLGGEKSLLFSCWDFLYKAVTCISLVSDPLQRSKTNTPIDPLIAKLSYLNIPATSVPKEWVFSTAGDRSGADLPTDSSHFV